MLPSTSSILFAMFDCTDYDEYGRYLRTDHSIDCALIVQPITRMQPDGKRGCSVDYATNAKRACAASRAPR